MSVDAAADECQEILELLAALVLFAPSRQTTTLPFATAVVKACDVLTERGVRLSPNDVRELADSWLAEMPADVQSALLRYDDTKGDTNVNSASNEKGPRFYDIDWDRGDHLGDLVASAEKGDLVPIVDEEDGGIIAYVIGHAHADLVMNALEPSDTKGETP